METTGLLAKLGLNTSEFRAGIRDATDKAKDFKRSWSDLGVLFAAGGILTAVVGFFRAVVNHAQEAKGELDENTAAVRRFSEYFSNAKNYVLELGAGLLGVVTRTVEWIAQQGKILNWGRETVELHDKIEKQTAETLANIEKQKKTGEEIAKVLKETEAVQRRNTEEAAKQLPLKTQVAEQERALATAMIAAANISDDKLAKAKADLVVAQERGKLEKLQGDLAKENAKADEKAASERLKVQEKLADQIAEDDEEEKQRSLERGAREREVAAERIAAQEEYILSLDDTAEREEEILRIQNEQKKAIMDSISLRTVGKGDTEISDDQLRAKVANLERDIGSRKAATFGLAGGVGGAGGYALDPFISLQESYLAQARSELIARDTLRRQVAQFGEQGAARFYQSNLPEFDRLLALIQGSPDSKRSADRLDEINERLRTILPRY